MRLLFTNRYDFLSLDHLSAAWRLQSAAAGGAESCLAGGSLLLAGLAPGESREVEIHHVAGLEGSGRRVAGGGRGGEFFLHVEARLSAKSDWASEGHLVAWGCFSVEGVTAVGEPQSPLCSITEPGVTGTGNSEDEEAVAIAGTTCSPPPALIVYEEEEETSSREGSPMGQL